MHRGAAIVVFDLKDLDAEIVEYSECSPNKTEILYISNVEGRSLAAARLLPEPKNKLRTGYRYFQNIAVLEYLMCGEFSKVVFWKSEELALATLRAQSYYLGLSDCSIALASSSTGSSAILDKSEYSSEDSFLRNESMKLCVHLVADHVTSLRSFLENETNPHIYRNLLAQRKRITVCICHKDRPHYLYEALSGFGLQSYSDFDILVVDDGSKEKNQLYKVIEGARRELRLNIQLVEMKNSIGPGACRNMAARLVETPFLLFFDDDNIPNPDLLERMANAATTDSVDTVSCGYRLFRCGPEGMHMGSTVHFSGGPIETGLRENCFGDTCTLFNRQTFLTFGGFVEDRTFPFEDWHLLLKMKLADRKMLALPVELFLYRDHNLQRSRIAHGETSATFHLEQLAHAHDLKLQFKWSGQTADDFGSGWKNFERTQ